MLYSRSKRRLSSAGTHASTRPTWARSSLQRCGIYTYIKCGCKMSVGCPAHVNVMEGIRCAVNKSLPSPPSRWLRQGNKCRKCRITRRKSKRALRRIADADSEKKKVGKLVQSILGGWMVVGVGRKEGRNNVGKPRKFRSFMKLILDRPPN